MKQLLQLLVLFFLASAVAQTSEGYWDNSRTTTENVTLRAGEKKYIKSADFPTGTTEVVYRITILDDNQKLTSSLVSLLKSIPDPTGISQGTAGAVFLLSSISGDDKCNYSIYSSQNDCENYIKTNKTTNSCFVQDVPINKVAKLLAANSSCISSKTQNLWFCFQSDNWLMKQKIIIEIVPWINKNLSRGWNVEHKKEVINYSKTIKIYPKLSKKEQFSSNFLEEISRKYTFNEYTLLLPEEKKQVADLVTESSLKNTGEVNIYYNSFREASLESFKNGNLEKAFTLLQTEIINKNRALATDYCTIGSFYLLTKQFDKAEKSFLKGIELDATETILQLQLAHLYLFTNRFKEAKEIHKKYRNQNINATISWIMQTKTDFELFKKYNFPENNFKKVLKILE